MTLRRAFSAAVFGAVAVSAAYAGSSARAPGADVPEALPDGVWRDEAGVLRALAPAADEAFTIDVSPHNGENVNFAQGASVVTYGSPVTRTMDISQSVHLFYASSQAAPRGFVQVEVTDNTGTPPDKYSIKLTNSANAAVTFVNGVQENFYVGGAGATRLAAQFDASALATGIHAYTVTVRKWRNGAVYDEASAAVKVIVVNERTSALGAGWTVSGVPRLTVVGDDALLADGDGTALAFRRTTAGASTFTSPQGDFTKLVALAGGTGYRRTLPDSTRQYFSSVGRVDSVVDRFSVAWRYTYDAGGRLVRVKSPTGRRDTLIYNGSNKISQIKDPGGRAVTLTVNASGDLVTAVDADGVTAYSLTYDPAHRVSWWTNRASSRTDITYDSTGSVAKVTSPTVTADGSSVRPETSFRSVAAAVLPAWGTGTTLAGAATRVVPGDVRVRFTDARGKITYTTLDRFGNPTKVEQPLGVTQVIDRNAHSQITRSVSHTGLTVWNDWTGAQLTRVRNATLGDTVNYEYDAYDQVTRSYGTSTPEVRSYYSTPGQLDSIKHVPTGRVTKIGYGTHHLITSTRDGEGHVTWYEYDATTFNVSKVKSGASAQIVVSESRFDAYGRTRATVNQEGGRDSVVYDLVDRVVKTFNPANDSVVYTYTNTYLSQVRDPIGQTFGYTQNAMGWTTAQTDPRGQSTQLRYDRNGNLTGTVNRRGHVNTVTYDDLNRPLTRTDGATSAVTTFAYDSAGQWVMTNNAESRDSVFLDAAGRVTSHVTVRGGTRYVLNSTYGKRDLRTGLTMTAPWTRSIGYKYNTNLQLDTLTDLAGGKTWMTYDDDGMLVDTRYPTILQAQTSFPSSHTPAGTYYTALGTRPLSHGVLQDNFGRRAERWNVDEDTATTYSYHTRGFLEQALTFAYTPSPLCPDPTTSSFDPDFGRRVLPSAEPDCEGFTEDVEHLVFEYDAVGNPTSGMDTGNRLLTGYGYTMQYDADGNLTSRTGNGKTQTFTWDGLGYLTSVTTNGATTYYYYDGSGRRVRKVTPSATTKYLYDGDNLFMELDGSNAIVREYTFFPGVDRPHSLRAGGQTYYYMSEGEGNVTGLVNSSNQLVNRYRYDPFGNATLTVEAVSNPLRYTGREYDAESGLYFYRARYYAPDVRRFISEDPIGLLGGINPYVYVGNDPVNNRDPYGMSGGPILLEGITAMAAPGNRAEDNAKKWDDWAKKHNYAPGGGGAAKKGYGKPQQSSECGTGFSDRQCERLKEALDAMSRMSIHCNHMAQVVREQIRTGGLTNAGHRFYSYNAIGIPVSQTYGVADLQTGAIKLYDGAWDPGMLMVTLAHEAWHSFTRSRREWDEVDDGRPHGARVAGNMCRG